MVDGGLDTLELRKLLLQEQVERAKVREDLRQLKVKSEEELASLRRRIELELKKRGREEKRGGGATEASEFIYSNIFGLPNFGVLSSLSVHAETR